jgi:hypothetical protein
MLDLIDAHQSSIQPEQVMNEPQFHQPKIKAVLNAALASFRAPWNRTPVMEQAQQ